MAPNLWLTAATLLSVTEGKSLLLSHATLYAGHSAMITCDTETPLPHQAHLTWNKTHKGVRRTIATAASLGETAVSQSFLGRVSLDQSIKNVSILHIKSVTEEDAGCYECTLQSPHRKVRRNICISVSRTIPASISFEVENSELLLTCRATDPNAPLTVHWGNSVRKFHNSTSVSKAGGTTTITTSAVVAPPSILWGATVSCHVHTRYQKLELLAQLGSPVTFLVLFLLIVCAYSCGIVVCCCALIMQTRRLMPP